MLPPQDAKEEIITNLKDAVKGLLMSFYQNPANQKAQPQAIVFYRDGVDEGKVMQVLTHEYAAIRQVSLLLYNAQLLLCSCCLRLVPDRIQLSNVLL